MTKKIVMKVRMNCERCRRKVMKTVSGIKGVVAAALEGKDNDRLAVVGDGVDPVALATLLIRKKMGFVEFISIGLVREKIEKKDEEGGGEKKDKGGGGKGGGGSEKKDKPNDSEKKDKEGGGRAGEKNDRTSGELRKMGANKVYCGMFTYGPGTCAEAVLHEQKAKELAVDCSPFNEGWLLAVPIKKEKNFPWARIHCVRMPFNVAAGAGTVTIHLCEWANRFSPSLVAAVWLQLGCGGK